MGSVPAAGKTEAALKSPTVLVVEDEVLIRLAIADYLRECGFGVIEAVSAAEALIILQEAQLAIDVIFTDVNLPGEMNGFGLARWARSNKPGAKVIITSGVEHKTEELGGLCDDGALVSKPYDHREVEHRIKRALAAARQAK
jgi:DNA-binding response OmpR family regulator